MKYFAIFLLVLLTTVRSNAQFFYKGFFPYYVPTRNLNGGSSFNIHRGQLVTQGNDTLSGYIKVGRRGNIVNFYREYPTGRRKAIPAKNISYMKIYDSDTTLINRNYSEYYRIKNKLYRRLINGSLDVYDRTLASNEAIGYFNRKDMLYEKNGDIKKITKFWTMSYKKDLINFLNREFDKNYKSSDFDSSKDILALIKQYSSE